MNRIVFALVLALAAGSALAEGAGGPEFLQVVGQDLWPLPGGGGLPATTGSISAVGGMGYGADEDGNVIGGFGLGVSTESPFVARAPFSGSVRRLEGGYGGTLQGWQHRWGPLLGLFTTRTGFGGVSWDGDWGFSLLGTAGAQFSYVVLPWFAVGLEAGVAGTVTFLPGRPFQAGYAPTVALRLLWGSF